MNDNDKQLIFCKGCHKFKPTKGAIWDFIFQGFVCKDCYNKLLKTLDMWNRYIEWCKTDEGKSYLQSDSKYIEGE